MTGIGLDSAQLGLAFPFHVAFDRSLRVMQVGEAWRPLASALRPGAFLAEWFRMQRPDRPLEPDVLDDSIGSLMVMEFLARRMPVRGQLVRLDNPAGFLFLGSPWIQDLDDLARFGLSLDAWPAHDAVNDYLLLLQTRQVALDDARELAGRLAGQRAEMRARGDALRTAIAARESVEARAQLIVDTALDAVVMVDRDSRVTMWNAQAASIFGWTREEAMGQPMADLIIPERLGAAHAMGMARYLATGEAHVLNSRIEVPARHRDGHEFPVELTISPIGEGEALQFSAFLRDVSERQRRERIITLQYELTNVLASAQPLDVTAPRAMELMARALDWDFGALWIPDPHGALACVGFWSNPDCDLLAFADITRTTRFARGVGLPGQVWDTGELAWVRSLAELADFTRRDAANDVGLRSAVAMPLGAAAGIAGAIEFFSRHDARPDPQVLHTFASLAQRIGQFIERERAIGALRRSEMRTRAVIDHMLEGLLVVAPDLRILQANAAFGRIFGYTVDELVGRPITQLMPDTPEYQDLAQLTDRYRQSVGRATEQEGRRRDGTLFPIEMQAYEFEAPEGTLTAAHIRDLSSERAVERIKQQFVASVSHELRTPLTAIRGALGLLTLGAAGPLSAEAHEVAAMAERNAKRLMGIIDDILDFERLRSGVGVVQRASMPLDRVIAQAVESAGALATETGVALSVAPTPLWVDADEARITQVLVNLMSNALKFSPRGSTVDVWAERGTAGMATVRVRDRGRGVPQDQREIIFEPFRQSEQSDARKHGGAGLGLSICRTIVRQHGGEIEVEETPGGGSTFWFTVPLAPVDTKAEPVTPRLE